VDWSTLKEKARKAMPPHLREMYRPFVHLAREEVEVRWAAEGSQVQTEPCVKSQVEVSVALNLPGSAVQATVQAGSHRSCPSAGAGFCGQDPAGGHAGAGPA
jgi:hypothetical protein